MVRVVERVEGASELVVAVLERHVAPEGHRRRLVLQRVLWLFLPLSLGCKLGGCPSCGEARPHRPQVVLVVLIEVGLDKV